MAVTTRFILDLKDKISPSLKRTNQQLKRAKSGLSAVEKGANSSFATIRKQSDRTRRSLGKVSDQLDQIKRKQRALANQRINSSGTRGRAGMGRQQRMGGNVVRSIGRLSGGGTAMSGLLGATRALPGPLGLAAAGIAAVGIAAYKASAHMISVAKEMRTAKQVASQAFVGTGEQVEAVTLRAKTLSEVMGTDYKKTVLSSRQLMAEFGFSSKQAFDFLEQGYRAGANQGGNMLELIKEQTKQMRGLGLTATEQLALMTQAQGVGASEQLPTMLKSLKEELPQLNKKSRALVSQLTGTPDFFKKFKDGQINVANAMQMISKGLAQSNLSQEAKGKLIGQLFNESAQDGMVLLQSFAQMDSSLAKVVNKNKEFNSTTSERIALQKKITKAQMASSKVWGKLSDKFDVLKMKARVAFYEIINRAMESAQGIWENIKTLDQFFGITKRLIPIGQMILKNISRPFKIAAGAIRLAATAVTWIQEKWATFKATVANSSIGKSLMKIKDYFKSLYAMVKPYVDRLTGMLTGLKETMSGLMNFDQSQISKGLNGIRGRTTKAKPIKDISKIFDYKKVLSKLDFKSLEKKNVNDFSDLEQDDNKKDPTKEVDKGLESIAAGGNQVRNVTVNIEKQVGVESLNTTIRESMGEIERMMQDMLLKVIQNTELVIAKS